MEFAIATVDFWDSVGFNTTNWRKSTDGTQALVHLEYALILVDKDDTNMQIYKAGSPEFKELLASKLWSELPEEGDTIG